MSSSSTITPMPGRLELLSTLYKMVQGVVIYTTSLVSAVCVSAGNTLVLCPTLSLIHIWLGAAAANLILTKQYGNMVGIVNGEIVPVPLEEVAGKLKYVSPDSSIIKEAKSIGISFGD